jgi:hypothetical protein
LPAQPEIGRDRLASPGRLQQCPGESWVRCRPGLDVRVFPSLGSVAAPGGRPRRDQPGARTCRLRARRTCAGTAPRAACTAETPANLSPGRESEEARCPEADARSGFSINDPSFDEGGGALRNHLRGRCGLRRTSRLERRGVAPGLAGGWARRTAERSVERAPPGRPCQVGGKRPRGYGSGRQTGSEVGLAASGGLTPCRRLSNARRWQTQRNAVPRPRDQHSRRFAAPLSHIPLHDRQLRPRRPPLDRCADFRRDRWLRLMILIAGRAF